jgi:hypothetical protein
MSLRPARLGSSVKRLKLGSLEVSADVEPQREATAAEANTATEDFPRAQSGSAGWRWDKQKPPRARRDARLPSRHRPARVCRGRSTHDFFDSVHGAGGFVDAVVLLAVIGRRAVRRVSRRCFSHRSVAAPVVSCRTSRRRRRRPRGRTSHLASADLALRRTCGRHRGYRPRRSGPGRPSG